MANKSLEILRQEWYDENAPVGREFGYPECCIRAFCMQPPELLKVSHPTDADRERYEASKINGEYSGFIPCHYHAQQILRGEITLQSLIRNRNVFYAPFPYQW